MPGDGSAATPARAIVLARWDAGRAGVRTRPENTAKETTLTTTSRLVAWVVIAWAVGLGGAPGWSEELKIGAVGTLSGGGTEWGLALQRGMTVAVDEINAAGGVKVGGKSYTIKMIMYDDQYTAQGGTTAATRLVNVDGVKFIIGPVGSPPVLGVLELRELEATDVRPGLGRVRAIEVRIGGAQRHQQPEPDPGRSHAVSHPTGRGPGKVAVNPCPSGQMS